MRTSLIIEYASSEVRSNQGGGLTGGCLGNFRILGGWASKRNSCYHSLVVALSPPSSSAFQQSPRKASVSAPGAPSATPFPLSYSRVIFIPSGLGLLSTLSSSFPRPHFGQGSDRVHPLEISLRSLEIVSWRRRNTPAHIGEIVSYACCESVDLKDHR